jgi:hypothetical protein
MMFELLQHVLTANGCADVLFEFGD